MNNDNDILSEDLDHIKISSSYCCSPENCHMYIPKIKFQLKIFHLNIRSIGNTVNFNLFIASLSRLNINMDILVLSECWLSKCPHIPKIPGFLNYNTKFYNQNDGVVIYVRDTLDCTISEPDLLEANCLLIKSADIAILAIYRPPSFKNVSIFLDSLDQLLTTVKSCNTVAIIGDININIVSNPSGKNSDTYLDLTAAHAMLPGHLFPTCSDSCLDHVMLKTSMSAATVVLDSPITDHVAVILFLGHSMEIKNAPRFKTTTNIPECVTELEKCSFDSILNCKDAEVAASMLVTTVSSIVTAKSRTIKIAGRKKIIKPWITTGLLRCIRHRDKLYRKTKQEPNNETIILIYKRYRTFCNNLLKRVKAQYEALEFKKRQKRPRDTWKLIKQIANLNSSTSTSIELLSLAENQVASANIVNNYFSNVGKNLASKIGSNGLQLHPNTTPFQNSINSMVLLNTDCKEINSVILGLKQNCAIGWDGISTTLIKAASHVLIPILNHVFNLCFDTGVFPTVFKKALVHPIYKGGDRDNVSNYRPISVLSTFSKILEKILNNRLLSYLKTNDILARNQYGFRPGVSTEDAVVELTSIVGKHLNGKCKALCMFLDLSKAFDTVSLPVLVNKLKKIGVRGIVIDLFKSYLTDRSQSVVINNIISKSADMEFGVPQGSVLGPTLFLIYINDLCKLSLLNSDIVTYADDTAIIVHGKSWDQVRTLAQSAIISVNNWLSLNLLTLNLTKTNYITFSPVMASQPDTNFKLVAHQCGSYDNQACNCIILSRTHKTKYLGVIIDANLSWTYHIESLTARVRKLIYVFKKLRSGADQLTLKTVYYALAQSIMSYCISAWGAAGKTFMLRLERSQRAILKVMAFKPRLFPTVEIYNLWQVLSIRKLYVLSAIIRKHSQTQYDPQIMTRRRFDLVCKGDSVTLSTLARYYYFISPILYNRINRILNIYPLSIVACKYKIINWLKTLSYDEVEALIKFEY